MVEQPFESESELFDNTPSHPDDVVIHITEENIRQSYKEALEKEKPPSYSHMWKSWSTMVGGTFFMILVGSVYITGNITPYIASFYGVKQE